MSWLVVYLPLWKRGVSRDGYSIPNWMESHKIPWFQSPPSSFWVAQLLLGSPFLVPWGTLTRQCFRALQESGCDWASTAVSAGAQTPVIPTSWWRTGFPLTLDYDVLRYPQKPLVTFSLPVSTRDELNTFGSDGCHLLGLQWDDKVSCLLFWLAVDLPLWKNMKVSWDHYSQYTEQIKTCSKPPTRHDSGPRFSKKLWQWLQSAGFRWLITVPYFCHCSNPTTYKLEMVQSFNHVPLLNQIHCWSNMPLCFSVKSCWPVMFVGKTSNVDRLLKTCWLTRILLNQASWLLSSVYSEDFYRTTFNH